MKKTNYLHITLITFCFITLQACGPSIPRTELSDLPPLIEIVSLNLSEQQLKLRVSHRNKITRKDNQLSCQLALKDFIPIKFNRVTLPDMTTYAKETIDIKLDQTNLPKVDKQQKGLPYVLDCYIFSENFRDEQIIKKASLFKVPGISGEYR